MGVRPALGAVFVAGLALAACSPVAPVRGRAFYAANVDARAQTLIACRADPGRLGRTTDCAAAAAAEADAHVAHFYDVRRPAARVAQPGQL